MMYALNWGEERVRESGSLIIWIPASHGFACLFLLCVLQF